MLYLSVISSGEPTAENDSDEQKAGNFQGIRHASRWPAFLLDASDLIDFFAHWRSGLLGQSRHEPLIYLDQSIVAVDSDQSAPDGQSKFFSSVDLRDSNDDIR
jgi:hypothetical protein